MTCKHLGKMEFAYDGSSGKLKEVHRCKNKQIEFIYCETALKYEVCKQEQP